MSCTPENVLVSVLISQYQIVEKPMFVVIYFCITNLPKLIGLMKKN